MSEREVVTSDVVIIETLTRILEVLLRLEGSMKTTDENAKVKVVELTAEPKKTRAPRRKVIVEKPVAAPVAVAHPAVVDDPFGLGL